VTGYDPIKDASGKVIGIWYVGFVDIHYRFCLRVQDGPKRPAVYAARHIGGYADKIITRLYEKRSRAAGLSLEF
jgi:hypothetical protein